MEADACTTGIAAVLSQLDKKTGKLRLIESFLRLETLLRKITRPDSSPNAGYEDLPGWTIVTKQVHQSQRPKVDTHGKTGSLQGTKKITGWIPSGLIPSHANLIGGPGRCDVMNSQLEYNEFTDSSIRLTDSSIRLSKLVYRQVRALV